MSVRSATLGVSALLLVLTGVGCGGDSTTEATADVTAPATTRPAVAMTTSAPSTTPSATSAATSAATSDSTSDSTSAAASEPVTEPPTTTLPPLFDFSAATSFEGWSVVNDTVMGGVSSGQLAIDAGVLVFTGELSLDNSGGFASVRSPLIDATRSAEWADRVGPRIRAEGDGRTWTVEVRTDDFDGGWISTLTTSADSIVDTTLPWSSFEPVTRFLDPRPTAEPLDPSRVVSIAFYLVDGIEAPFRLGIHSIA